MINLITSWRGMRISTTVNERETLDHRSEKIKRISEKIFRNSGKWIKIETKMKIKKEIHTRNKIKGWKNKKMKE